MWTKRIHKNELWDFLFCMFMQMTIWFAVSATSILLRTLLVKRLGIESIPYLYIIPNLLSTAIAFIFILFSEKIRKSRIFIGFCFANFCLLMIARILFSSPELTVTIIWVALILSLLALGMLYTMIAISWTMTNELFHPRQARRLYPLINLGGLIGGLLAGSLIPGFVKKFDMINLYQVNALATLILGCLIIIHNLLTKQKEENPLNYKGHKSSIIEIYNYISISNTIKAFIAIVVLSGIIMNIQDFLYTQIMNLSFHNEESLSIFFGYYSIFWNATAIILEIFIAEKLLLNVGVFRGMFFLPAFISVCFLFLLIDFSFWPGLIMNFGWFLIGFVMQSNAFQLGYNVVPIRLRARIRALIDGAVFSFSSFLGGMLLLGVRSTSFTYISWLGFILGIAWVCTVAYGRRYYIKDLVRNLHGENRKTILETLESMEERREPTANQELMKILTNKERGFDLEVRAKVMDVLSRLGNSNSLELIGLFLRRPEPYLRQMAIRALNHFRTLRSNVFASHFFTQKIQNIFRSDSSGPVRLEAGKFLIQHMPEQLLPDYLNKVLEDPDPYARISIIESISKLNLPLSGLILLEFLQDLDFTVRAEAIVHLHSHQDFKDNSEEALEKMLISNNPKECVDGLTALIRIGGDKKFLPILDKLLESGNSHIKSLSALAYLSTFSPKEPSAAIAYKKLLEALEDSAYPDDEREKFLNLFLLLHDDILDEFLYAIIPQLSEEKQKFVTKGFERIASIFEHKLEQEHYLEPEAEDIKDHNRPIPVPWTRYTHY